MFSISRQQRVPADYQIACICPMGVESAPVEGMLDVTHNPLPTIRDQNAYTLGSIGGHNIVIVIMPEIGNNAAATAVTQLLNDFPAIRFGLLVGIGGGVPGDADIRLGDVVVSQASGTSPGVVQYDMGKELVGGQFLRTGSLNKPPPVLSANVRKLDGQHRRLGHNLREHVSHMIQRYPNMQREYSYPAIQDRLFVSTYTHRSGETCDGCDVRHIVQRPARPDNEPRIHYGTIGSANKVVKDASLRDSIRTDTHALCIEMEAGGLMSDFPCLVIRGICDYADSHKNKQWQSYAAAVAAAYMKALLLIIPVQEMSLTDRAFRHTAQHQEINNRWTGDLIRRPDNLHSSRSHGSFREMASFHQADDFTGPNIEPDQIAQVTQMGDLRLAKRVRLSYSTSTSGLGENGLDDNAAVETLHTTLTDDRTQWSHRDLQQNTDDTLLQSLLFERINFRVNNVKRPLVSTCKWLFCDSRFQTWYNRDRIDQHSGFLWIKGKPGCGKSTLMKAAYEWVQKQKCRRIGRKAIVPYFFNARASASLEKSRLGLYRTVVHHLVSLYPAFRTLFMMHFASKNPGSTEDSWTIEELQGFLEEVVESGEQFELCLFIDALDEAEYDDDIRQMISFLIQLSERAMAVDDLCRLWICLSSRHYPYIRITKGLSLVVEDQPEHGQDIERYIAKILTYDDGPEKDDLQAKILSKSSGIFLWVILVVRILNQLDDQGALLTDMKTRLETIPEDLNQLFIEILTKNDNGLETTILLFQWMAFRQRPLEPVELFAAIEYSKSPNDQTWTLSTEISVPPSDRLARFFLNCSRGLVEIAEVAPTQAPVVQFIHETVREFLLKDNGLALIVPALAGNLPAISHEILRIACLRRVSMTPIPEEYKGFCTKSHKTNASFGTFRSTLRSQLPFLDYAISHLFDHAEQAQRYGISQQAFLQGQIDANGLWVRSCRDWWNILERYASRKVRRTMPLTHFIVQFGNPALLQVLLSISHTINVIYRRCESALHIASLNCHEEVVQMLLDAGADVNAQGTGYDSVLQATSARGHDKVVQMLLNAGADVNVQGGRYSNALQAASACGHDKVVQKLLNAGADVNAKGEDYGSALQAASACGHDKVVQTLLDAGADVNAQGGYYGSALQAASARGSDKVVQTLLDAGADVNAQQGNYGSALHRASKGGRDRMVRILLKAGADVNAQGQYYDYSVHKTMEGSALQAASAHGYDKVVQILLNAGADINAQHGNYGNALQAASTCGANRVVQTLLDAGADVNAQGGYYSNALQAASACGHDKVVQKLLNAGADVNAKGEDYGSALQAASACGHDKVVQTLLNAGADVNA